jgi:ACR3 family arsenite transporter
VLAAFASIFTRARKPRFWSSWPRSVAPRLRRFDAPAVRALLFTGATPNAAAGPRARDACALTAAVIVTQTLVELPGMLVYVCVVPRLVPSVHTAPAA